MIFVPRIVLLVLTVFFMFCFLPGQRLEAQSSGYEHAEETHQKIERLRARIDELRENIDESPAQDGLSYRWSRNLGQLRTELSEQMERLRVAGTDTWNDLLGSVEGAVQGLEGVYNGIRRDYYLRQVRQQLKSVVDMVEDVERRDDGEGNPVANNLLVFRDKVYEAQAKTETLSKASPEEWPTAKHDVNYALEEVELTGRYLVQKYALWRIQERVEQYEQALTESRLRSTDPEERQARERLKDAAEQLKDLLNDVSVENPEEWAELKLKIEGYVSTAEQDFKYLSREQEP